MCVVFGYLQTWKKALFSLSLSILTCFGRICMYILIAFMTFLSCYIILSYWAHLCCKWLFCCMHYNLQSQLSWPNVYITFIHVVLTTNNIDVVMVLSTTYDTNVCCCCFSHEIISCSLKTWYFYLLKPKVSRI